MIKIKLYLTIALLLGLTCSSCEFMRKAQSSTNEKSDVAKSDSGHVKTNEVDSRRASEYEKTTYIPIIPSRDTTVINNYLPVQPQTQPYIIIQERGKSSEQIKETNTDSAWRNDFKELVTLLATKKTETEGGILTTGQLIAIVGIGVVLIGLMLMLLHFKNQILNIKNLINKN